MPPPPRKHVQLEARVLSARGLVSAKGEGEPLTSGATLTFLDLDPVDSELVSDTCEPEFGLAASYAFHANDASCKLLLTTPLTVAVFEGAEKQPLGEATLSLEPLMQSAGMPEQWLPLTAPEGAAAGEVLVAVVAPSALMSEEDWEESTMLTVSVDSLHKLPATWGLADCASEADHPFSYKAEFRFLDEDFVFADGKLVLPEPPAEPSEPAEPAEPTDAPVDAEAEAAAAPAPAEAPAAADPEALEEATAASVTWEGAKIVRFLGPEATNALRKQLQAGEAPFTLTLTRDVKNAETHFDSNRAKYSATCGPLLAGLLVVDTTECIDRAPLVAPTGPFEATEPPEAGKGKGPEVLPPEEEDEVHPYAAAATYVKMSLQTSQPLEPKPLPPPPPLPKVSELVPKRVLPQFAPKTAVEEFDAQVALIVESMVNEWSALFPDLDPGAAPDDAAKDDRRRALLYQLNNSGKYWMFKEKLKRSVVRLVKDTMSRPTSEPLDSRASDLFYNDLYVQLTQRLHRALNGIFFPPTQAPLAPSMPDQAEGTPTAAVLGSLAEEMEMVFSYEAAANYHKERIASSKHLASAWHDYALFLMRTNDAPMAEEYSRESIALSPATGEYLRAHGAILASRGNFEQAEVFLKAALEAAPNDVGGWLVVALLYDLMERPRDQRTAVKAAKALCDGDLTGAYLDLAYKLLPTNSAVLIELALQMEEQFADGATGALLLCRGELQLYSAQGPVAALETLEAGLELARKNPHGYLLLGLARFQLGEKEEARTALEKALERSEQPYPLQALLLLGQLCLDAGDSALAKQHFLEACRQKPSCTSWLSAGEACHALGELDEAEECYSEANVLNNRHPIVWGELAVLCLERERLAEAEQALHEAYKHGLASAALLTKLGSALLSTGQWQAAEGALLRSLSAAETPLAKKLLADALLAQHHYEDALETYKAVIALSSAPEALVAECRDQAQKLLTVHLNRPDEAYTL